MVVVAIDHKPKTSRQLRRLSNIEANPQVSVLFDHRSEDWSDLWWVRADGIATIFGDAPSEAAALITRYDEYRTTPPTGPWVRVEVTSWTGWSAT